MDKDRIRREEDAVAEAGPANVVELGPIAAEAEAYRGTKLPDHGLTQYRDESRVSIIGLSMADLHHMIDLPGGWTIRQMWVDPETRRLCITVWSEDFDTTSVGERHPDVNGRLHKDVVMIACPGGRPIHAPIEHGVPAKAFWRFHWTPEG